MALTAAPSAPSLSPRPIHREAARAAASVTRTSSMARLRSGACGSMVTDHDDSGWRRADPPHERRRATGLRTSVAGRAQATNRSTHGHGRRHHRRSDRRAP